MFSQLHDEEVHKQPGLFGFNAGSGTLHEDLIKFYCCIRPKFAIKAYLCSSEYLYVVDSDMWPGVA